MSSKIGRVDAFAGPCGTEVSVLWDAINELDREECYVLLSLWGIGRLAVSDREVAEELSIDVEEVWNLQDGALRMLGLHWLMSFPLGTAYRDFPGLAEPDMGAVELPKAA